MKKILFLLSTLLIFEGAFSKFLVLTTTESSEWNEKAISTNASQNPILYEMDIRSNISNRFAKTLVVSKVKNDDQVAKETTFTVILPEKAFISEFIMEMGGKNYKAYVKEKEEAKNIYNQAVAQGQSAGHISATARDSNRFTVSLNIEPDSKAVFLLTYEELLERKNGHYELVLNIHPHQIVKNLNVLVNIDESRPLKYVNTPSLRSGNEISKNEEKLDSASEIRITNSTAVVKFNPDSERQKQYARDLGGKESDGLSGQFVVQYDVERDPYGGEVLLQDGYFVHFFAPSDLEPLPKHVLFVLDTSGSMGGSKISQLKDAMYSIINQTRSGDLINIIEFSNDVKVWNIINNDQTTITFGYEENYEEPFHKLSKLDLPAPVVATEETLNKARQVISGMWAMGGTNMIGGLEAAIYLAKIGQESTAETAKLYQPIIIFLTDGEPNVGIGSTEEIIRIVTRLNTKNNNVPIFSLSFGYGADKEFLRKLSLKNLGFSRHIYEDSDASLQLQEFYKEISSPLLSKIIFKYNSGVKDVTKSKFSIFFQGSELVVTGRYEEADVAFTAPVHCVAREPLKPKILIPTIGKPVSSLERLWAYLTVKDTLEKRELAENKTELTKKALDLALKYSFVTDVTSLVVVKPNETISANTQDASKRIEPSGSQYSQSGGSFPQYQRAWPAADILRLGVSGFSNPSLVATAVRSRVPSAFSPHGGHRTYSASAISGQPSSGHRTYSASAISGQPSSGHSTYSTPRSSAQPTSGLQTKISNANYAPRDPIHVTLPWLVTALNPNGTLSISSVIYELGETYTTIHIEPCPKTPINDGQSGTCTLLKDCSEVHQYLGSLQTYEQYFCPIENRFAGVCCPKKIIAIP